MITKPTKSALTSTKIHIGGERKIQLEEFAAAQHAPLSAAIGHLIKFAQNQGMISHGIPQVQVRRATDGIAVAFDDQIPIGFAPSAAKELAEVVRTYADGSHTSKVFMNLDHDYEISRQGRGVTITIPLGGVKKTWAPDLAHEFADLLDAEAAKFDN
ncbi:hypothetical protein [Thalassorhabdomicrobium marinisediminis]|uniref:Uncharacterized protein n=1 Tax=Thalassorhabdomicrobium marinisediminis TaxID=2170577 RepID=A0A2T7FVB1_9RHOB|nr:hypothetical protein [Thalassorhabdomicrobium marinisediminis]PVA06107.1 hypothetical protein DC363_12405 [Thalassorhabdomicrobium marinisediminis]